MESKEKGTHDSFDEIEQVFKSTFSLRERVVSSLTYKEDCDNNNIKFGTLRSGMAWLTLSDYSDSHIYHSGIILTCTSIGEPCSI